MLFIGYDGLIICSTGCGGNSIFGWIICGCTGCTGISWGTANLAIEVSTIWGGGIFTTGLAKTGVAAGAEPPNIAAAAPTPTKAARQGIAIAKYFLLIIHYYFFLYYKE